MVNKSFVILSLVFLTLPDVWGGNNTSSRIKSCFNKEGYISHPIESKDFVYMRGFSARRGHKGIDISVPEGTKIRSVKSGVIETIKWDKNVVGYRQDGGVGFGYYLIIHYDDGNYGYYGHLKPNSVVLDLGKRVSAGEVVALSGNSGTSTGPHLHYGEKNRFQKWIDPTMIISWAHLQDYPSVQFSSFFNPKNTKKSLKDCNDLKKILARSMTSQMGGSKAKSKNESYLKKEKKNGLVRFRKSKLWRPETKTLDEWEK